MWGFLFRKLKQHSSIFQGNCLYWISNPNLHTKEAKFRKLQRIQQNNSMDPYLFISSFSTQFKSRRSSSTANLIVSVISGCIIFKITPSHYCDFVVLASVCDGTICNTPVINQNYEIFLNELKLCVTRGIGVGWVVWSTYPPPFFAKRIPTNEKLSPWYSWFKNDLRIDGPINDRRIRSYR